jgi:2'-5' RNA ligase
MRLFVAFEIPEATRRAVGKLIARLTPLCATARWSKPEAMHVTLKFIGEVEETSCGPIRAALAGVRLSAPVGIKFRGLGFFPNPRHPRVLWAGVEGSRKLALLAADIEQRLVPLGVAREEREFRPHLTLARFPSEQGLTTLRANLEAKDSGYSREFGAIKYSEFHLIESQLRPEGAVYSTLETFRFTGEAK